MKWQHAGRNCAAYCAVTRKRSGAYRLQLMHPTRWIPAFRILIVMFALFIACDQSRGRELLSLSDELGIMRDFAEITISPADAKEARAFLDAERLIVPQLSREENSRLQRNAIATIGSRLHLVGSKNGANYLIQIRMYLFTNFAVRNPSGRPSQGFVMMSLCRFPIGNVNCENLQYDFFKTYAPEEIFSKVLNLWLDAKIKPNQ